MSDDGCPLCGETTPHEHIIYFGTQEDTHGTLTEKIEAEREACAQLAKSLNHSIGDQIAELIRNKRRG